MSAFPFAAVNNSQLLKAINTEMKRNKWKYSYESSICNQLFSENHLISQFIIFVHEKNVHRATF